MYALLLISGATAIPKEFYNAVMEPFSTILHLKPQQSAILTNDKFKEKNNQRYKKKHLGNSIVHIPY